MHPASGRAPAGSFALRDYGWSEAHRFFGRPWGSLRTRHTLTRPAAVRPAPSDCPTNSDTRQLLPSPACYTAMLHRQHRFLPLALLS
jgi:hypothetical protein